LENYNQALSDLNRSFEISTEHNMYETMVDNLLTMSSVYKQIDSTGKYQQAIQQAQTIATDHKLANKTGMISTYLGGMYKKKDNLDSALHYYLIAKKTFNTQQKIVKYAPLLVELGDCYYKKGEIDSAQVYFSEAYTILKQSNDILFQKKVLGYLWDLNFEEKKYELAHEYANSYVLALNAMHSIETDQHAEELVIKYETEKKELEIEKQNIKIEKQKASIRFYIILVLLIGTGGVLIGLLFLKKQRAFKNLAEKNYEIATKCGQRKVSVENATTKQNNIYTNLIQLIMEEKIFTDIDLTIHKLAKLINTNRTELSEVIDLFIGKSYPVFINENRINHAVRILSENPYKYTMVAVANDSGFKSVSNFNKLFKELKGLTPSEHQRSFRKQI